MDTLTTWIRIRSTRHARLKLVALWLHCASAQAIQCVIGIDLGLVMKVPNHRRPRRLGTSVGDVGVAQDFPADDVNHFQSEQIPFTAWYITACPHPDAALHLTCI
jgi:hypothetical protein